MSAEDLSKYVLRDELFKALKTLTNRTDIQLLNDIEINRATTGVEGFLSLVLRVKAPFCYNADERRCTEVFILKCMPKEGFQSEIVKASKVFSREGLYFDKVIPLLKIVSAGKIEIPLPMCYHSVYGGDDDVLYMEDLTASGHKTPDPKYRTEGLDFEHCSLAMKSYGKLHALTVVAERLLPEDKRTWLEAFPELKKDAVFHTETPGETKPQFKGILDEGAETILWISKQLDGIPKEAEASGKLRNVIQKTWDVMCKLVKPSTKGHNVLTHGDCWMNNLMFRYERALDGSNKPVGVKFVDLQNTRYCHPSLDLLYFIFCGTRKSFRMRHIDELISIYYNSFVENLKILNHKSPPFTLDEFKSDMFGVYKAYGHYCETLFCPIMFLGNDFTPSKAEDMTPERYEQFISTGNSSTVRDRFSCDSYYRGVVSDFVRDFVDAVFPNGFDGPESPLFRV